MTGEWRYEPMIVAADPEAPHVHEWEPVAIVYVPNSAPMDGPLPAVAQSCHCGAVQSVVLPGALR